MRVLIDMDGVLVNIQQRLIDIYNKEHGTNLTLLDIRDYNMSVFPEEDKVLDYFLLPDIFAEAEPIDGAIEAVQTLIEAGNEIVICTSCPYHSLNCLYQKRIWIDKHFSFWVDEFNSANLPLVATDDKNLIRGDILIDDCPENIERWNSSGQIGFLFPRPWNSNKTDFDSKVDWDRIINDISKI